MAAAQPPWPPPGSPQFAGVRDAWRDATLAEWFLHHPQGKALFRIWAAMQRARLPGPPSGAISFEVQFEMTSSLPIVQFLLYAT